MFFFAEWYLQTPPLVVKWVFHKSSLMGQALSDKHSHMTPEEKARKEIDRQLLLYGWVIQDYRKMNISAGHGVAVRAFPLTTGDVDYLLFANGKVRRD